MSPPHAAAAALDGAAMLLSLPDDVLSLISSLLLPCDLVSLSLSSRSLRSALSAADKLWWLPQCLRLLKTLTIATPSPLPSYLALCRFLTAASPLLGVWVHQNPELGNVVAVTYGASPASLVACRAIPQQLDGPLLWSPVFEILADQRTGSLSLFFLHGRTDKTDQQNEDQESLHPGSLVGPVPPDANVLLLEVDLHRRGPEPNPIPNPTNQFSQLAFRDRRKLLELVVRHKLPAQLSTAPLLSPVTALPSYVAATAERRSSLVRMHKYSGRVDVSAVDLGSSRTAAAGKLCFKDRLRQLWRSGVTPSSSMERFMSRNGVSFNESKHVQLSEFLKGGDTIGLCLRAANMKLSTYRTWPNMHDSRFALYKLPLQEPGPRREYAGLWGGTFGWPPGKPSEHKQGKALFFLSLSYEEVNERLHLTGTKILEGTHYVLHPNGSTMFSVEVDDYSREPFPWEYDGDSRPVEVERTYDGEGIASGYGFRYPGSKPGSLFVIQNGILAFVWKESKAVLTLQRLDLEELLKKGERVPALPPIANFAYLTKSYSNVFVGFSSNSSCSSSPRFD